VRWSALVAFPLLLWAQEGLTQSPDAGRPAFKPHRFDEDWRAYCTAAPDLTNLEQFKCLTPWEGALLTFGGELRERFEAARHPGFGLRQDSESVFLHRALLHADLRVGSSVRAFAQFGYYEQSGRDLAAVPTDVDRLDLAQGFLDLSADWLAGRATLRGGRQEMSFGSSRLVAVREGPNARRSFDGVRAFWTDAERRVDAFYVRPVALRPGTFDDETDAAQAFWGLYATGPAPVLNTAMKVDLYYLGYERDRGAFAAGTGREERHTLGARLFGSSEGWDWDVEAAYQFGDFAGGDIRAWTVASEVGFTFEGAPLTPRVSLKADVASGDGDPGDRTLGTFNALYPKLPYFSEAGLVAPANIVDVHPTLELTVAPPLTVRLSWNGLWRQNTGDAIYSAPLNAIPGTAGRAGRFIGQQAVAGFTWRATPSVTVSGEYVRFWPGEALERAGGKSVDYLVMTAGWRF